MELDGGIIRCNRYDIRWALVEGGRVKAKGGWLAVLLCPQTAGTDTAQYAVILEQKVIKE